MRKENLVVEAVVRSLRRKGFQVNTEVPNFHRSADVAAVDRQGNVWVIECKVSSLGRAIEQCVTHKLAADKVLVATPYRKTRDGTVQKLRTAGLGLMYVMPDGSIEKAFDPSRGHCPWNLARDRLRKAIVGLER